MAKGLEDILDRTGAETKEVLEKNPPYEDVDPDDLDADGLPDAANKTWFRVEDISVVFVDLENSTQLSVGKHPRSTAAIYRAATGNASQILHDLDADFIQIQGDGVFGIFWGDRSVERAICAGITVKTFSEETLQPALEKKWPKAPSTGFKVGVASGRVLVKKVGTARHANEQEPIWAGKPVNYAAKAAQQAKRNELIVTGTVWDSIEANDYLTVSCSHKNGPAPTVLWEDIDIERLTHDADEAKGRLLKAKWCNQGCGPEYMAAILDGKTVRDEADGVRATARAFGSKVWEVARQHRREATEAHKRGMSVRHR